jgi:hypothetical protein
MVWWEGQDDRLPLSLENLFYNGCRISSDSLTTDSLDTPDGGPVVEVTTVDPNVIIYSTQTPSDGGISTEIPVGSKPPRIMPSDVLVSSKIKDKNLDSAIGVSSETATLKPLKFIPSISNPKLPLVEDKTKKIINKFLNRNEQL